MGNEPNSPPLADEIGQNLQDLIQRAQLVLGIEAAEAFVDEDRVQMHFAVHALDHVGQAQRQRQRRDEGLSPRQRRRRARLARVKVENTDSQPSARPAANSIVPLQLIPAVGHRVEPLVRRAKHEFEHCPDRVGLEIEPHLVFGVEKVGQVA